MPHSRERLLVGSSPTAGAKLFLVGGPLGRPLPGRGRVGRATPRPHAEHQATPGMQVSSCAALFSRRSDGIGRTGIRRRCAPFRDERLGRSNVHQAHPRVGRVTGGSAEPCSGTEHAGSTRRPSTPPHPAARPTATPRRDRDCHRQRRHGRSAHPVLRRCGSHAYHPADRPVGQRRRGQDLFGTELAGHLQGLMAPSLSHRLSRQLRPVGRGPRGLCHVPLQGIRRRLGRGGRSRPWPGQRLHRRGLQEDRRPARDIVPGPEHPVPGDLLEVRQPHPENRRPRDREASEDHRGRLRRPRRLGGRRPRSSRRGRVHSRLRRRPGASPSLRPSTRPGGATSGRPCSRSSTANPTGRPSRSRAAPSIG